MTSGVVVTVQIPSGPFVMSKPPPTRTRTFCASGATTRNSARLSEYRQGYFASATFSVDGTHSPGAWAQAGGAPSAASAPITTSIRFIVCALPSRLESRAHAERKEPHLVQRDGRDLAELRAGRVQLCSEPLLAVEDVLRVEPGLPGASTAGAETAQDRQVRERQRHAAHPVDAEREGALLEGRGSLRRIPLEPRVDVEPAIARRVLDVDVVEIAVEEDVLAAPVEQRARLELPC